jgi:hypothetical protein
MCSMGGQQAALNVEAEALDNKDITLAPRLPREHKHSA